MAVPKKKTTKSKRNMRRSHHGMSITFIDCPKCKKKVVPHTACSFCGYYRAKQILEIKTKKKDKKEKASSSDVSENKKVKAK